MIKNTFALLFCVALFTYGQEKYNTFSVGFSTGFLWGAPTHDHYHNYEASIRTGAFKM